jgi:hypothetical protein
VVFSGARLPENYRFLKEGASTGDVRPPELITPQFGEG